VLADKAPLSSVDKNGKCHGYDVYFARRIGKDLLGSEDKVKYVFVESPDRITWLQENKVDIMLANFTNTPERAKLVDFALPYMKAAIGVLSPKSALITSIDQLKGKTLITINAGTAPMFFAEHYPDIRVIRFDTYDEIFTALDNGRAAAMADDNSFLFGFAAKDSEYGVGIPIVGSLGEICPAVRKGNTTLLNWLNNEIRNLPSDFFAKDCEATLKPYYGDNINADYFVVENGKIHN
jgi:polar amino acid transport system substrate-binding protein